MFLPTVEFLLTAFTLEAFRTKHLDTLQFAQRRDLEQIVQYSSQNIPAPSSVRGRRNLAPAHDYPGPLSTLKLQVPSLFSSESDSPVSRSPA